MTEPIDARFADAVSRHLAGDLAAAERLYRHILDEDPNHTGTLCNLGVILATNFALRHTDPVPYRLQIMALYPFAWLVLRAGAMASVRLSANGVVVTNWALRYDIPWTQIHEIQTSPEVRIILSDGRHIRVATGSFSLVGKMRGYRWQRYIKDQIERAKPATDSTDQRPVTSHLDLRPIPFILIGAVLAIYILTVQYLP